MYFPNVYRKVFFIHGTNGVSTGAIAPATVTSANLLPGQLGIYYSSSTANALSYLPNLSANNATSPTVAVPFYLAMGSWFKTVSGFTSADKIGVHGGYQESVKSKMINPKYISRVIRVAAKGAQNQVVQIKTANGGAVVGLTGDTTYRLRIDAKGAPALRFLNHQLYRTLDYYVPTMTGTNTKHPVWAFLSWKDQINSNPLTAGILQARVYTYAGASAANATAFPTITTSSAVLTVATTGGTIAAGQKIVGLGLPANSFVVSFQVNTSITVGFPPQGLAPTLTAGAFTLWNEAVSSDTPYTSLLIPGTSTYTNSGAASAGNLTAYNGADAPTHVITSGQEPQLEISAAYYDTVFGNATFTPTDYYNLEPITIQASMVDETGLPSGYVPASIPVTGAYSSPSTISATVPYLGTHGFELQRAQQATGLGETIMRDMILDGRYRQEAFPDSGRVESMRMREIEQNPSLSLSTGVNRSAYYDQVLILHSVPRFNNPSGMFDTDQYLIQVIVPAGTTTTNLTTPVITMANLAQGAGAVQLESYN